MKELLAVIAAVSPVDTIVESLGDACDDYLKDMTEENMRKIIFNSTILAINQKCKGDVDEAKRIFKCEEETTTS